MYWPEEDVGTLRVALNAVVRVFRLQNRIRDAERHTVMLAWRSIPLQRLVPYILERLIQLSMCRSASSFP